MLACLAVDMTSLELLNQNLEHDDGQYLENHNFDGNIGQGHIPLALDVEEFKISSLFIILTLAKLKLD